MTNAAKDEAAFPRPVSFEQDGLISLVHDAQPGMTIRDWFAGQALAGMRIDHWEIDGGGADPASPTRAAYAIADAMLKARGVKE